MGDEEMNQKMEPGMGMGDTTEPEMEGEKMEPEPMMEGDAMEPKAD